MAPIDEVWSTVRALYSPVGPSISTAPNGQFVTALRPHVLACVTYLSFNPATNFIMKMSDESNVPNTVDSVVENLAMTLAEAHIDPTVERVAAAISRDMSIIFGTSKANEDLALMPDDGSEEDPQRPRPDRLRRPNPENHLCELNGQTRCPECRLISSIRDLYITQNAQLLKDIRETRAHLQELRNHMLDCSFQLLVQANEADSLQDIGPLKVFLHDCSFMLLKEAEQRKLGIHQCDMGPF